MNEHFTPSFSSWVYCLWGDKDGWRKHKCGLYFWAIHFSRCCDHHTFQNPTPNRLSYHSLQTILHIVSCYSYLLEQFHSVIIVKSFQYLFLQTGTQCLKWSYSKRLSWYFTLAAIFGIVVNREWFLCHTEILGKVTNKNCFLKRLHQRYSALNLSIWMTGMRNYDD